MQMEQHMRNLRVIRAKVGKARTPKDHEVISKEITEAIKNIGCNPEKIFYTINNNKTPNLSIRKAVRTRIGTKKIGEGAYGEVFFGCVDKECKKDIAIKVQREPLGKEYRIGKLMSKFGGTSMYALESCKGKHIMYSEYANGGTLEEYIDKNITNLRPIHFRFIITHVLYNLYRIHKKYPSFRHNDLHANNILVNMDTPTLKRETYKIGDMKLRVEDVGLKLLLNDYGLSTMKNIVNPNIGGLRKEWGIDPKSHFMYDTHLFLNAIYLICARIKYKVRILTQRLKNMKNEVNEVNKENLKKQIEKEKLKDVSSVNETIQFILRILPSEYRGGKNTNKIENFRMRFGVSHTKMPNFEKIFSDPYFLPYKSQIKKRLDPLSFLPKATPLPKQKPKTPQNNTTGNASQSAAMKRAKAVMNKEKQKKAQPLKRRLAAPITIKPSPPKVTIAPKGYTRIDGKKCITYKKSELIEKANKAGINTQGKTVKQICDALKLKYLK
jgi:hypothetical protein